MLARWNWNGDWFQSCRNQDQGGHMIGSIDSTGFPIVTIYRNGKFASEHRILSAEISENGYLTTNEEVYVTNDLVALAKAVWVREKQLIRNLSVDVDVDAINDVPSGVFAEKPEGMVRGTHLHFQPIRDGMLVDSSGRPIKPSAIYYRCGGLSS